MALSSVSRSSPTTSSSADDFSPAPSSSSSSRSESDEAENRVALGGARCAVCGDAATGFHYFTSSCNGCKTFFRRTVVSRRKFECKNGGRCDFDKNRRCACRACRFEKCVKAGMNPQAIQYTPSANLTLSIARKRFSKKPLPALLSNDAMLRNSIEDRILQRIGYVLRVEEKHLRLRLSTYNPFEAERDLSDYLSTNSAFGEADRYALVEKWPPRAEDETDKEEMRKKGIKFWYFIDMILSCEYIKTFHFYPELSPSDQIAWARSVTISGLLLSSAYYAFTKKADVIIYPDGSVPINSKGDNVSQLEVVLRHGVVSKVAELRMDQIQYTLTRAIIALNDTCLGMSEQGRDLISQERSEYTLALLRYLQNKRGVEEGTRMFAETVAFVNFLYRRVEYNKNYYAYRRYITRDFTYSKFMIDLLDS